jgi:hypothetical protein
MSATLPLVAKPLQAGLEQRHRVLGYRSDPRPGGA